jgi:4-diphosphocytidyl-2-C-methyl-D-erythritol kinase
MRTIRALAPAKVNLTFDIKGLMPDGYHEVETLLQSVDLQDEITISVEEAAQTNFQIVCTNEITPRNFPTDDSNLMVRAGRLLLATASGSTGYQIHIAIEKNIPVEAGLAGGSADAAAVLVGLNHLLGSPLSGEQLCSLGKQIGADVPFCIIGGTASGTGRGDDLRPIASQLSFSFCIVKPRALSVSTPWAYQQYDQFKGAIKRPDIVQATSAMENADIELALQSFGNVFEPVILSLYPDLSQIKEKLSRHGVWYSQLSGSGPAIFSIVADREQAHYIRRKILKTDDIEFDYVRLSTPDLGPPLEFYIAQSLPNGVTLHEINAGCRPLLKDAFK